MSALEAFQTSQEVDRYNKTLNEGKKSGQDLDKDDFLKILITQLSHQDPTAPMEDKEFIAQMAQFSSLEQMTNMATNFSKLSSTMSGNQAVNSLGLDVDIQTAAGVISGQVTEVSCGDAPQVKVNNTYYDYNDVLKVKAPASFVSGAYEKASANPSYGASSGQDAEQAADPHETLEQRLGAIENQSEKE
jgi:flagellar basal-body rod modification protein FlgD